MSTTNATETTTNRFDVRSPDGTPLAVWVDGEAPALVLVHAAPSDHSTFDPLVHERGATSPPSPWTEAPTDRSQISS